MDLTSHLSPSKRDYVERRLRSNLMAWLTTVRPSGQPETVPVWFYVRDDETVLLYSRPGAVKLRNIAINPRVTLVLDVTDIGRDVIRVEGIAQVVSDQPCGDRGAGVSHQVPRADEYALWFAGSIRGGLFGGDCDRAGQAACGRAGLDDRSDDAERLKEWA